MRQKYAPRRVLSGRVYRYKFCKSSQLYTLYVEIYQWGFYLKFKRSSGEITSGHIQVCKWAAGWKTASHRHVAAQHSEEGRSSTSHGARKSFPRIIASCIDYEHGSPLSTAMKAAYIAHATETLDLSVSLSPVLDDQGHMPRHTSSVRYTSLSLLSILSVRVNAVSSRRVINLLKLVLKIK